MSPKKQGLAGLLIAFVIALPLFVWTAINVNFNSNEKAQGEPNFCGGTCGSNYNCQANFFCFEGFCRNPICSKDTDCICDAATATPTIKPSPTTTSIPKGGNEPFVDTTDNSTSRPTVTPTATATTIPYSVPVPENQFFAKYAIYVFGAFVLLVISTIYYAIKKNKTTQIPHIMPPTNI